MDISQVHPDRTGSVPKFGELQTWKFGEGSIEVNPFTFLDFIRLQYNNLPTGFRNTTSIVNLGIPAIAKSFHAEIGQLYTVLRCIRYSKNL